MTAPQMDGDALGRPVLDACGERIGSLVALYVDTETDDVIFGGVRLSGFRRRRTAFVSLVDAIVTRKSITVTCGKQLARNAPSARPGHMLPVDDEPALYAHYELSYGLAGSVGRRLAPRSRRPRDGTDRTPDHRP